jgi:hypothetical protein
LSFLFFSFHLVAPSGKKTKNKKCLVYRPAKHIQPSGSNDIPHGSLSIITVRSLLSRQTLLLHIPHHPPFIYYTISIYEKEKRILKRGKNVLLSLSAGWLALARRHETTAAAPIPSTPVGCDGVSRYYRVPYDSARA